MLMLAAGILRMPALFRAPLDTTPAPPAPVRPALALAQRSSRGGPLAPAPRTPAAGTATPRPTATVPPPTATPTPTPLPPTATPVPPLPGDGPAMAGELIARATRYDVYLGYGSFDAATVQELIPQIDAGLDRAERLAGSRLAARTSLAFYRLGRRPAAGVRAMAYSAERRLELFYAPGEDSQGAVRVAVHELGHQLESDRYGQEAQRRADTILHEGLATWLAGEDWLERAGSASWRARGRDLLEAGRLLPIRRDPAGARANDAYEGWASFVDYLIGAYGWERFDQLYRSGDGRYPGSADYRGVYGRSLDELAAEWRGWFSR